MMDHHYHHHRHHHRHRHQYSYGYGGGYARFGTPRNTATNGGIGGREYVIREFLKGAAEMSVQFGKGCRDIVAQSVLNENSFIVTNLGGQSYIGKKFGFACDRIWRKLLVLNDYLLPEDKDPLHAWSVICFVILLAFAAMNINTEGDASAPLMKAFIYPSCADRILLPDGRYIAYKEQGVPADRARFSMIVPHGFLSSRLAGIPGVKASLLEEFGIHLLTYDLPGFGESDPHPNRNLKSSALDMSFLANAVGVKNKFWVVGYSSGSLHTWAALRHIPDKLAGAAMFAPMVNPYDSLMTKEEKIRIWEKWTQKRKFMNLLARRFPKFLAYSYHQSFLSGKHGQIDTWLSLSLGKRDKALIEDPVYEEFWQRDLEESIRQGNAKPFIEEAVLQVSNWCFGLRDIKFQKKQQGKGILNWLKLLLSGPEEEYTGFLGPIHIWQGMDDEVVPPMMTDFVHRLVPGAAVHKLPYEGHFTYFCFCDECHRQIFTMLFGIPQGPLDKTIELDQTPREDIVEEHKVDQAQINSQKQVTAE